MKHKAYLKSTGRLFLKHIIRLLSISAIFVVTVSLISGLGDVESDIKKSINTSYLEDNIHDLVIRGSDIPYFPPIVEEGASEHISKIQNALEENKDFIGIDKIEKFYTFDTKEDQLKKFSSRVIFRDLIDEDKRLTDKLELLEGNWPSNENEILVERETNDFKSLKINDYKTINISSSVSAQIKDLKVVGIVKNPTMVAQKNEPSDYYEEESNRYIDSVIYCEKSLINKYPTLSIVAALNVTLKDRNLFNAFNDEYKDKINEVKAKIDTNIQMIGYDDVTTLTLFENYSLLSLNMYGEKVGTISVIFIAFFILIAVLVVYSTSSRLLDEERASMAVLKTLGYSNFTIAIRYVIYVLLAGIIGVGLSVIPSRLVSGVILNAFNIQYAMKQIAFPVVGSYFFILASMILFASLLLTFIKSITTANHTPIELLTPRAPKPGKKVLLERIKIIWNRLSFKHKSTCRNVFFFKARLFMTVISIMASTVLVFASFSLLNNANKMDGFESLQLISIVLIGFSAALCAIVIYNITNINISERTREIATLMVLGYRNPEVTGYVYREIYILTVIGAILGLPAGVGFVQFIFTYVGVFELSNVEWWTYLVSPILTFVFALLATRLLHRKIVKTDMNESLKVLE